MIIALQRAVAHLAQRSAALPVSMPAMANSLPPAVPCWLASLLSSRPALAVAAGCKKRTRAPPGGVQLAYESGQLMACGAACWR